MNLTFVTESLYGTTLLASSTNSLMSNSLTGKSYKMVSEGWFDESRIKLSDNIIWTIGKTFTHYHRQLAKEPNCGQGDYPPITSGIPFNYKLEREGLYTNPGTELISHTCPRTHDCLLTLAWDKVHKWQLFLKSITGFTHQHLPKGTWNPIRFNYHNPIYQYTIPANRTVSILFHPIICLKKGLVAYHNPLGDGGYRREPIFQPKEIVMDEMIDGLLVAYTHNK